MKMGDVVVVVVVGGSVVVVVVEGASVVVVVVEGATVAVGAASSEDEQAPAMSVTITTAMSNWRDRGIVGILRLSL
jgi:hypothetical protein